jgi:hypothetical protein
MELENLFFTEVVDNWISNPTQLESVQSEFGGGRKVQNTEGCAVYSGKNSDPIFLA